jgi:hypothetical protein
MYIYDLLRTKLQMPSSNCSLVIAVKPKAKYEFQATAGLLLCILKEILKMAVFWVLAPCSMVEIDRPFTGAFCSALRPVDGSSKHL